MRPPSRQVVVGRHKSLLVVIIALSAIYFTFLVIRQCQSEPAWDFSINWTAAQGMRQGISLYSQDQLRILGQSLAGPAMDVMFRDSFTSYIGPPTTALLLLPFTLLAFPQAVLIYRIVIGLVFVSS